MSTTLLRSIVLILSGSLVAATSVHAVDNFYRSVADPGENLPTDRIFPSGRIFPFGGYSPDPAREKANGFTLLGPIYPSYADSEPDPDDLAKFLGEAELEKLPVVYPIGLKMDFDRDLNAARLEISYEEISEKIAEQVTRVRDRKDIAWWSIEPEELLFYREPEMEYLKIVCEAIRANDPLNRPIYMYDACNRGADGLGVLLEDVNVVGKGMYVNFSKQMESRVWCRWSMEQQAQAIQATGQENDYLSIALPEMFEEPPPDHKHLIPVWARHDVYSGLAGGAQGVIIFSLWARDGFPSFQEYYNAYVEIAKELTGKKGLGQIFLFGQPQSDLKVSVISGPEWVEMTFPGGNVTSPVTYSSLNSREIAYKNYRYLLLVNDANENVEASVDGFPAQESKVLEIHSETPVKINEDGAIRVSLEPWGVKLLRFEKGGA